MHILLAALYGVLVWLPYILYTAATDGSVWLAVALGPAIVSGAACGLILLDWGILWICDRVDRAVSQPTEVPDEP